MRREYASSVSRMRSLFTRTCAAKQCVRCSSSGSTESSPGKAGSTSWISVWHLRQRPGPGIALSEASKALMWRLRRRPAMPAPGGWMSRTARACVLMRNLFAWERRPASCAATASSDTLLRRAMWRSTTRCSAMSSPARPSSKSPSPASAASAWRSKPVMRIDRKRLRITYVPMSTTAMKKRHAAGPVAFIVAHIASTHPSVVTTWNTVRKAA
mmetsp:Transcript_19269/g.59873  ORF Transcript_19269/g.59873 Transcript_19269/m.59873 type:complete len:213 (-) Transcript_19269:996-1634(-)